MLLLLRRSCTGAVFLSHSLSVCMRVAVRVYVCLCRCVALVRTQLVVLNCCEGESCVCVCAWVCFAGEQTTAFVCAWTDCVTVLQDDWMVLALWRS